MLKCFVKKYHKINLKIKLLKINYLKKRNYFTNFNQKLNYLKSIFALALVAIK